MNVLNTCIEMLEQRGYAIQEHTLDMIYATDSKNFKTLLVILNDTKLNIDTIKTWYGYFIANKIQHAILVYDGSMTSSVKKVVQQTQIELELFEKKELRFNITKHILVPKHVRIEKTSGYDYTKFPVIRKTDPVCRFYNFAQGDLIKITRKNGSVYYRIVR